MKKDQHQKKINKACVISTTRSDSTGSGSSSSNNTKYTIINVKFSNIVT